MVYDSGTTLESLSLSLFSPRRRKVLLRCQRRGAHRCFQDGRHVSGRGLFYPAIHLCISLVWLWSLLRQTKKDTDGELVSVRLFRGGQLPFFSWAQRMRFRGNFFGLSAVVCDLRREIENLRSVDCDMKESSELLRYTVVETPSVSPQSQGC